MEGGKHCPVCGADIGIWPIFSTALPNRVRCPHCRSRLRYRRLGGAWLVVALAGVVVGAAGYIAATRLAGPQRLWAIALIVVAWAPLELGLAYYLRSHKVLEQRTRG